MTFQEALKDLGIEEYGKRIFNSNSNGELFYLQDYFLLAEQFKGQQWFPKWFKKTVELAEEKWERPASVFQHILKILQYSMQAKENKC